MPTRPKLVKAAEPEFPTWEQLVEDAQVEPYRLPVGDEVIEIAQPTTDDLKRMGAAQQSGDLDEVAGIIFGDAAERIMALAGPAPAGALNRLIKRVTEHFNQVDLPNS